MVGLQQGAHSEDVHETAASRPQTTFPSSSHSALDHGDEVDDARPQHLEHGLITHVEVNGTSAAFCLPVHLLSACSGSSRNMCPFSNSITSQEILSGVVRGPSVPGTSVVSDIRAICNEDGAMGIVLVPAIWTPQTRQLDVGMGIRVSWLAGWLAGWPS